MTESQVGSISGGWQRDKNRLVAACLGLAGIGLATIVGMVLRHETQLAVIGGDVQVLRTQMQELRGDVRELLQRKQVP